MSTSIAARPSLAGASAALTPSIRPSRAIGLHLFPGGDRALGRGAGEQEQVATRPLPVGEGEPRAARVGRGGLDAVALGQHQRNVGAARRSLDQFADPGRFEQRVIAGGHQQRRAEAFECQADAFARPLRGRQQGGAQAPRLRFDGGVVGGNGDCLDPGLAERPHHAFQQCPSGDRGEHLVRHAFGHGDRIGRTGARSGENDGFQAHRIAFRPRQTRHSTAGAASSGCRSRHGVTSTATPVWRSTFHAA